MIIITAVYLCLSMHLIFIHFYSMLIKKMLCGCFECYLSARPTSIRLITYFQIIVNLPSSCLYEEQRSDLIPTFFIQIQWITNNAQENYLFGKSLYCKMRGPTAFPKIFYSQVIFTVARMKFLSFDDIFMRNSSNQNSNNNEAQPHVGIRHRKDTWILSHCHQLAYKQFSRKEIMSSFEWWWGITKHRWRKHENM